MTRYTIFFLVAVALVCLAQANPVKKPQKCGPNEVFTTCGTACPPTCEKRSPMMCTMQCVVGCECRKGLLRNKRGKCVEPCDC